MSMINSFPGYEFVFGEDKKYHNMYRGTDLGLGGYVYAEPGMYVDVALLDAQSLHPTSFIEMNYFGEYTKNYKDIYDARVFIKHKEFDKAKTLLDGSLAKYLDDEEIADSLSTALKIPLNSTYGLSSASFDNPCRDSRNKNNIVALRGALFMRTLQDEVAKRGFTVAHIKTDSIKIPNATPEIISFVKEFGKMYGYNMEHEATYDRMCLVNNAVYIAKYATVERCYELYSEEYVNAIKDNCKNNKKHPGQWTATGAQFQHPYIFKTQFTHEPLEFKDMCETKEVKGSLYLNFNESGDNNYKFVGKIGEFCPMIDGVGAGELVREATDKEGNIKYDAVTGTKGYRWMESEQVKNRGLEDKIDLKYYDHLVCDAIDSISSYGDYEWFVN